MAHKLPTVTLKDGESPLITWFKKQVYKKNNCINGFILGGPGLGKSWSGLGAMFNFNPDFDLDTELFFSASKLVRAFDDENFFKKPGRTILFDEAGIDLDSASWQNEINKVFKSIFQTARSKNYVFLATVPFLTDISKGVRKLMNMKIKADGWSKDGKNILIPRVSEFNDEQDKFYNKRLVVRHDGLLDLCNQVSITPPPDKMIQEYEKRKKAFQSDLYSKLANRIEKFELKAEAKLGLTYRQESILNDLKKGLSPKEIAEKDGCIPRNIHAIINSLRNKGVKIQHKVIDGVDKGYVLPSN